MDGGGGMGGGGCDGEEISSDSSGRKKKQGSSRRESEQQPLCSLLPSEAPPANVLPSTREGGEGCHKTLGHMASPKRPCVTQEEKKIKDRCIFNQGDESGNPPRRRDSLKARFTRR